MCVCRNINFYYLNRFFSLAETSTLILLTHTHARARFLDPSVHYIILVIAYGLRMLQKSAFSAPNI